QAQAEAQAEGRDDAGLAVPQIITELLTTIDTLLREGRLGEVTGLADWLLERLGPDILIKLVLTHAELRGGPNQETIALMLLWGLGDPPQNPN
ncbi:MAG TPA: hypothetical protein PK095_21295, partial [Myxococcota bacterium]|nr:hypothetical protein [Myxococcota bacterium]